MTYSVYNKLIFEFGTPPSVTEKQIFTSMQNDGLDTIMILGL